MVVERVSSPLQEIFSSCPEIIAVYLFGSYLEAPEQARDVDLAVLLGSTGSMVDFYMRVYPKLGEIFTTLEVDLLFLNVVPLSIAFKLFISKGKVIYCADYERRTDFEYVVSGLYMDFILRFWRGRLASAVKYAPARRRQVLAKDGG